ncbi:MAG: LON peptidase substrate-binding domain-containing protein [Verrucomicrobiaceae bacterium]|nr:LON peptidase substrate-binding domain-containing protein [Verrucomicrobiaceae bacterium]
MMRAEHTRPFVLPDELPVMVLERCYLLPGGVKPLYIFEERYRRMLDHALSTHRMFCIGDRRRTGGIRPVTTAGVIATSVLAPDGTSQMVLHGIQRVRITEWIQKEPFPIAKIEPFTTIRGSEEQLADLARQSIALLDQFDDPEVKIQLTFLREVLEKKNDPEFVCDLITSFTVLRASAQRAVLEEASLVRRYEILLTEMNRPS